LIGSGDSAPEALPLRSEEEIMATWASPGPPLVSIICATYNHGAFIAAALQGMLGQVTDFPFEIIVRDDASSDGTHAVLRGFAERYPGIVRAVFETQNGYCRGLKAASVTYPMARGEFIALCDGDDYWLDPGKLQKQRDFLRGNPEFVVCYHDARMVDDRERVALASMVRWPWRRDASAETLQMGARGLVNSTLFYRNCIATFPVEFFRVVNGDYFLLSLLGQYGKGHFIADIEPAVYRQHSGGVWSMKSSTERSLHTCILGLGAVVRDGIRLAPRCLVGAGAVVFGDTEPDGVYVGNPARRAPGKSALDATTAAAT
jgi:Glycosyl transferase family 2